MRNNERTYGVEIEFLIPENLDREQVALAVRNKGVNCYIEGYNHHTRTYWKIVSDASVGGRGVKGWELVSPILSGDNGLNQIKLVCEALQEVGASVNRTCGLHVHHDARDFGLDQFKNILKIYSKYETLLDSLVAPSRRQSTNRYCHSIRRYNMEELLSSTERHELFYQLNRYAKLNIRSYMTHGTIEFRQHQGTLNAEKIINWIKLTQGIMDRAVRSIYNPKPTQTEPSWQAFKDFLFLNPSGTNPVLTFDEDTKAVLKYYNKRRRELAAA